MVYVFHLLGGSHVFQLRKFPRDHELITLTKKILFFVTDLKSARLTFRNHEFQPFRM